MFKKISIIIFFLILFSACSKNQEKIIYQPLENKNPYDLYKEGVDQVTMEKLFNKYEEVSEKFEFEATNLAKNLDVILKKEETGSPLTSRDVRFSGTSSACPNACGLIATILEFNRNWTVDDIKTWLGTLQNQNTSTDFYDIAEETTANGNGHADLNGLQGATARVIYQGGTYGHSTKEITSKDVEFSQGVVVSGSFTMSRS